MAEKIKNSLFVDRLTYVIARSKDDKKVFIKKCGKSEPQLYAYLKGTQEPGMAFFTNLKKSYPWVNLDWLISGQGNLIIRQKTAPIDPAMTLVIEVENELGIELNDRQREAVVAVLKRELDRHLDEHKAEISDLISSLFMDRRTE